MDERLENVRGGPKEYTEEELYRMLEVELGKHGVKVQRSSEMEFPATAQLKPRMEQFTNLSPAGEKVLRDLIERAQHYVNGVLTEANYEETREGRQDRGDFWVRLAQHPTYGVLAAKVRTSDKLRYNSSIGRLKSYLDWLVHELNKSAVTTKTSDEIRGILKEFEQTIPPLAEYGQMSIEQKKEVVSVVDGIARKVLRLVTTRKSGSQVDAAE